MKVNIPSTYLYLNDGKCVTLIHQNISGEADALILFELSLIYYYTNQSASTSHAISTSIS